MENATSHGLSFPPLFHKITASTTWANKAAYINKSGRFVWGPDSGNESLAARLQTQASVEDRGSVDGKAIGLVVATGGPNEPHKEKGSSARDSIGEISDMNLDGIKLADAPAVRSSADIPNGKSVQSKAAPSLGG